MVGLLLYTSFTFAGAEIELRPRFQKPSKVAELIRRAVGSITRIEPDDLKGTVKVWGPEDAIAGAERALAIVDVRSREIVVRFRLQNNVEKVDLEGTVVLKNNVNFEFSESEGKWLVGITPRITERASVEAVVRVKIHEAIFDEEREIKQGTSESVEVATMRPYNEAARKLLSEMDKRLFPKLTLVPTIKSLAK